MNQENIYNKMSQITADKLAEVINSHIKAVNNIPSSNQMLSHFFLKKLVLEHSSGIRGEFVETKIGRYGEMIIIKTTSGREFFAPSQEFKESH